MEEKTLISSIQPWDHVVSQYYREVGIRTVQREKIRAGEGRDHIADRKNKESSCPMSMIP